MKENYRLLVCTNGSQESLPAIHYSACLAGLLKKPITLLGVIETRRAKHRVEGVVQEAEEIYRQAGIEYTSLLESGSAPKTIAKFTQSNSYVAVAGPFGRPAWQRAIQGRTFRRLLARVETPLIYVPQVKETLTHILLCMGGLSYSSGVERFSIYLAQIAMASVTVLHIVEPVTMEYPLAKDVHNHWREILSTETPQGKNLRQAMERIQACGLRAAFKVKHGNPVHEILEEVRLGDYDMIAMGSAYSAHSLRRLYVPNITAEVAEAVNLPVLTVRHGREIIRD